MLPLIARQQQGANSNLRLETQFVAGGQQGISTQETDVLELIFDTVRQLGKNRMIQSNVIVDTVTVRLVRTDKAIVDQQLVVRMSAVRSENFFAGVSADVSLCTIFSVWKVPTERKKRSRIQ